MSEMGKGIVRKYRDRTVLMDPARPFKEGFERIYVPDKLVRQFKLVDGATVLGPVRKGKTSPILQSVESVCGLPPDDFKMRKPYSHLTAIPPDSRFNLSITGNPSMRVIDLIAPLAKGARGLIVSPPKAGKTILLEQIAKSIHANDPETRIVVLLIDERPEEVTHFRRELNAEIWASSNDRDTREHVALTRLAMSHVVAELEAGRDVVVLVDSLTRMGRAFNLKGSPKGMKGRIMSGGIQAGALEIPRRFFGLARNVEGGGSVTIIATVLVDTGSRMDQLIFEEFKGTGNNEIVLNRELAEARVFPAINIPASGTRREELLYPADQIKRIAQIRRALSRVKPREGMEMFLKLLTRYETNEKFFDAEFDAD